MNGDGRREFKLAAMKGGNSEQRKKVKKKTICKSESLALEKMIINEDRRRYTTSPVVFWFSLPDIHFA